MGYAHGTQWTNERIKQEIIRVKEALCIDRMPSRSEIELITGNSRLTNKISRSGGFKYWAKKLGLQTKRCETSFGKKYEKIIADKLKDRGYKVEHMSTKHPYDLLVNDYIKIDVKAAKPYRSKNNYIFHTFNLEKKNPTCDIYIAVALSDEGNIERVFIIPSKYLKITQLSVGKCSIYNQFVDRWDYIKKYDLFYKNVI